jgi:hypothetical protein
MNNAKAKRNSNNDMKATNNDLKASNNKRQEIVLQR